LKDATVYDSGKGSLDKDTRSTLLKRNIKPKHYPDICNILLKMINIWDVTLDPDDYKVNQFDYLKYGVNDHFIKHKDQIGDDKVNRVFSTSTIIEVSDDLEGGDFIIYDELGTEIKTSLEVGETIFFRSNRFHKVTPVTKGERSVLVAWIGIKT
jgi:predicted 2-oxoglutarate/Fe(II)-dependent dioxygenase YbiX